MYFGSIWALIKLNMENSKLLIGFIGQGYVGKNYADDFEHRGYSIIRYAKEQPYNLNKEKIKECDIVFVAVPAPTVCGIYDASILREVVPLTGRNKIIVLKSTISPGLTRILQKEFPNYVILHSPEFLSEATAQEDASKPFMNIIGIQEDSKIHKDAAKLIHSILPKAPFSTTVFYEEAELIKYTHNSMAYTQIVFFNLMYNLSEKLGANWKNIEKAIKADPSIPNRYGEPLHKSGRGAGGHCFIKDFAILSRVYEKIAHDPLGAQVLKSLERKNIELLKDSKKDLELLKDIYCDLEKK